jgi:hypothetical protein
VRNLGQERHIVAEVGREEGDTIREGHHRRVALRDSRYQADSDTLLKSKRRPMIVDGEAFTILQRIPRRELRFDRRRSEFLIRLRDEILEVLSRGQSASIRSCEASQLLRELVQLRGRCAIRQEVIEKRVPRCPAVFRHAGWTGRGEDVDGCCSCGGRVSSIEFF